jgi:heme/copper-type cytochrome/quinol oxidase subunit 2
MLPLLIMAADSPRLIEITATKDAKFKVAGQKDPIITVKPGQVVRLRIISQKGPEWAKDGAVHTFTIKELKDQGWDLRLKEGTQEFTLVAPDKPGEYEIVCLVQCGPKHEDMKAKLIVKP